MKSINRFTIWGIFILLLAFIYGCETKDATIRNAVDTAKVNVAGEDKQAPYQATGQVRNNKIDIDERNVIKLFWDDPVFKEFKETGKSYKEYEQILFDEARVKEIDATKLRKALDTAKGLKGDKVTMYLVVIETAKFNNEDCFVFAFTWEFADDIVEKSNAVGPLGHVFIVVIEANTQNVITMESCK